LNDYKPLEKDHPKEELVNNSSSVLNELPIDQSFDEPVDNILNSSEDLNELLKGYDDSKIPESDFEKIKESVSKDVENIQSDTLPSEKIEELSKFGLDQTGVNVIVTLRQKKADGSTNARIALDLRVGLDAEHVIQGLTGNTRGPKPVFGKLSGESPVFILDGEIARELTRDYK